MSRYPSVAFVGQSPVAFARAKALTLEAVGSESDAAAEAMLPQFTQRFRRLTKGMKRYDLIAVLRADAKTLDRLRNCEQTSLKLDQGLRLAARLGISPWDLVGEQEPMPPAAVVATGSPSGAGDLRAVMLKLAALEDRIAPMLALMPKLEALPHPHDKRPPRRAKN